MKVLKYQIGNIINRVYNKINTWLTPKRKPYPYIGGTPNEARQKYFDIDTELSDSVKAIGNRYNINPEVLASRLAKEGPIDLQIRRYNSGTNGTLHREPILSHYAGPDWGLDDTGSMIESSELQIPQDLKDRIYTKHKFINEKGRQTQSVLFKSIWDGINLTAATLANYLNLMKQKFPKATPELIDQYTGAAFNLGPTKAEQLINEGKIIDTYKPFIKLK